MDKFSSWTIVEFAHTKEFTDCNGKVRRRHYFKVECDNCNVLRLMEKHNLIGSRCQNCWCRPKGQSGLLELFSSYKRNATSNDREFDIDEIRFGHLTTQPCHYCGSPPSLIKRGGTQLKTTWGDYCYNGLDRIDNNIGYIESNVVSCCLICNRAKNDMSYNDFIAYIKRIQTNLR